MIADGHKDASRRRIFGGARQVFVILDAKPALRTSSEIGCRRQLQVVGIALHHVTFTRSGNDLPEVGMDKFGAPQSLGKHESFTLATPM